MDKPRVSKKIIINQDCTRRINHVALVLFEIKQQAEAIARESTLLLIEIGEL